MRATLSFKYCHCYTTNVHFMFLHFTAQQKLCCTCQNTDDGSQAMIACYNPTYKFDWFHFQCVGLQEEEDLIGQWFCPVLWLPDAYWYPRHIISIVISVVIFGFSFS